jgi:hypothetical protein
MVMSTSASEAAAPGLAAILAPKDRSGSARLRVRL